MIVFLGCALATVNIVSFTRESFTVLLREAWALRREHAVPSVAIDVLTSEVTGERLVPSS